MPRRSGDRFHCPQCDSASVAKTVREMDGWTVSAEYLACALCGAQIEADERRDEFSQDEQAQSRLSAAASFLGTTLTEQVRLTPEEGRFCRDCCHYLKHPFVSRCLLHERAVGSMDDCDDFERV